MTPEQPPLNFEPPREPQLERHPFWGYGDVFVFLGLTVAGLFASALLVKGVELLLRLHGPAKAAEIFSEQFLLYVFILVSLQLIFRVQYNRPLWRSLAWSGPRPATSWLIVSGLGTALGVTILGLMIQTPTTSNPMTKLLEDPASMVLVAVFGLTVGPICEELVFRGFLQPLLVRSMGIVPGIVAVALLFGLLHLQEYGNSWRHVLLISLAGASFGWMRQVTGSTKAAAIMHAAYNSLFFVGLLMAQRKALHDG